MNLLVNLLTMNFPYATETVCVMMAIQGSMGVRNTVNQKRQMHWFHSFLRSTLTAFAGASFTNIFMGRPTAMFSNDIFFGSCILGYGIVNWLPMDLGFHFFVSVLDYACREKTYFRNGPTNCSSDRTPSRER